MRQHKEIAVRRANRRIDRLRPARLVSTSVSRLRHPECHGTQHGTGTKRGTLIKSLPFDGRFRDISSTTPLPTSRLLTAKRGFFRRFGRRASCRTGTILALGKCFSTTVMNQQGNRKSVMLRAKIITSVVGLCSFHCPCVDAASVAFCNSDQVATLVASGATSDTISSEGYLFTYTRDKLFTGGLGGGPIGRPLRVSWPEGVEAQAVTAGPNPGKAKITIERVDGDIFDLTAFSAKLLANTAGAGGTFEVVPFLDGEEALANPVTYDATGIAGNVFSYDTSPNPLGSTVLLTGFDKYTIDLYVDFAIVGLTLEGAPVPEPSTLALLAVGTVVVMVSQICRRRS